MTKYLYKTTFVEIPSDKKWYESAPRIDPHSLVRSGYFKDHLNDMGAEGWRLVTVEALNAAEATSMTPYSMTKGYYFFWMKEEN
ncbi:MAG: hypothetical protein J0L94_11870 [Rhodothermia bacterium]|nr:hypothetical protein [Rhodothermia bacterium]